MPIHTTCPNPDCGRAFRLSRTALGRKARCKSCNTRFRVRDGQGELIEPASSPRAMKADARDTSAAATAETDSNRAATYQIEDDVPAVWTKGDVILDLYEVKGVLGEGGMGTVYHVHHKSWNLDLAVKCPKPDAFETARQKENFVKEAETWVNLGLHPHIVSCHYVRTLGGIPRVFAEYVDAGSLKDWIDSGKLYEGGPERALERILDIAIQFAWGLHYAHEQGLIHQDVKPANVMMTRDGTAKVTDFGLAKARAEAGQRETPAKAGQSVLVSSGGITPAYCSPEQANKQRLSRMTDIWSWAVSLLEMFTATHPRIGPAAPELLDVYIDSPDENHPRPPKAATALLRQCFQRTPANRPKDFGEIADRLQAVYHTFIGEGYGRNEPKAVELLADGLNNHALSLLDLGLEKEAALCFRKALKADPHHPQAIYNQGLLHWRTARLTDDVLLTNLERACGAQATQADLWALVAHVHLERDDCSAALTTLSSLVPSSSEDSARDALLAKAKQRLDYSRRALHELGCVTSNGVAILTRDGRLALAVDTAPIDPSSSHETTPRRRRYPAPLQAPIRVLEIPTGKCVRVLTGHVGQVTDICVSNDGRTALSSARERRGCVRVWDLASGSCTHTRRTQRDMAVPIAISGDGRRGLASWDGDVITVWDVSTGADIHTLNDTSTFTDISCLCLSQDGQLALAASSYCRLVRLWDTSSGAERRSFIGHNAAVNVAILDKSGKRVLSGDAEGVIRLWDTSTGNCLLVMEGHTAAVHSLCFVATEMRAVSGGDDKTLRLWDLRTARCECTIQCAEGVTSVSASADGSILLTGSPESVLRMWNMVGNRSRYQAPFVLCRILSGTEAAVATAAYWSAMQAAHDAMERGEASMALGLLRTARRQPGCRNKEEALRCWTQLYSKLPRGQFLGGSEVSAFAAGVGRIYATAVSRDGRLAVCGGDQEFIEVWDLSVRRESLSPLRLGAGTRYASVTADGSLAVSTNTRCVAINAGSTHVVSSGEGGVILLWDIATERCTSFHSGHTGGVNALDWSPDGRFVFSAGDDGVIVVWDVASARPIRRLLGHRGRALAVCAVPQHGQLISGSTDKTLKLWDTRTAMCLSTLEGHQSWITTVAVSACGQHAVSGAGDFRTGTAEIKTWNLRRGRCELTVDGHSQQVTAARIGLDGAHIVSSGRDGAVNLWDTRTGKLLRSFRRSNAPVNTVCMCGDERFVASGGDDGVLRTWRLDWDLEEREPADWNEDAQRFVEAFVSQYVGNGGQSITNEQVNKGGESASEGEELLSDEVFEVELDESPVAGQSCAARQTDEKSLDRLQAEVRCGAERFRHLLDTLSYAGYGWLRPDGVARALVEMWEAQMQRRSPAT